MGNHPLTLTKSGQKMTPITLMLIIMTTITLITLIIRVIGAPLVATFF